MPLSVDVNGVHMIDPHAKCCIRPFVIAVA